MAFKNILGMVESLRSQKYENEYTQGFISSLTGQEIFTSAQENEIVRLFNIHCMPAKFEKTTSQYPKAYFNTTRKKSK